MDKDTKKSKHYNAYNRDIVRRIREKYGVTPHFIYASLRGDRNSETSIKICEDYKKAERVINQTLNKI
ncbi:Transposase [Candidatus Ornithobacterium hominis]|uniref:hypothetical protein n=1 Tax=Candidatus Ornithobacterium hominis TaxID=2497989 RepID=UPI000E5B1E2D|nr:hypothetical protein [Candidatus Ornithobacterium hominis]CAI9429229.1 Transposase [Candidatus Ornithobacterium hominis]SZD72779.1 Uncharacterised protein [Candidatus Ornithobacterium hominis]